MVSTANTTSKQIFYLRFSIDEGRTWIIHNFTSTSVFVDGLWVNLEMRHWLWREYASSENWTGVTSPLGIVHPKINIIYSPSCCFKTFMTYFPYFFKKVFFFFLYNENQRGPTVCCFGPHGRKQSYSFGTIWEVNYLHFSVNYPFRIILLFWSNILFPVLVLLGLSTYSNIKLLFLSFSHFVCAVWV